MKIAVTVESTNDLTKELLERYDIKVIPYQIVLGGKTFKDGELSTKELFDYVDENGTLPKTNALNEFDYTEFFEGVKKEYDAIVHICLSGGMSSSCENARRAAKKLKNVFVVDSMNLSSGIGILAIYARELVNEGFQPSYVAEKVQERVSSVQASFVVERLDYLYKGGRCNALSLLGANIFKIRPRIVVKDGVMGSDKKYRGPMGKVIAKYCSDVLEEFNTPDLDKAFVTYSSATPEMVEAAKNALVDAGFKNIHETYAGCTVSSHCGPNTLGIIYFNDGKTK